MFNLPRSFYNLSVLTLLASSSFALANSNPITTNKQTQPQFIEYVPLTASPARATKSFIFGKIQWGILVSQSMLDSELAQAFREANLHHIPVYFRGTRMEMSLWEGIRDLQQRINKVVSDYNLAQIPLTYINSIPFNHLLFTQVPALVAWTQYTAPDRFVPFAPVPLLQNYMNQVMGQANKYGYGHYGRENILGFIFRSGNDLMLEPNQDQQKARSSGPNDIKQLNLPRPTRYMFPLYQQFGNVSWAQAEIHVKEIQQAYQKLKTNITMESNHLYVDIPISVLGQTTAILETDIKTFLQQRLAEESAHLDIDSNQALVKNLETLHSIKQKYYPHTSWQASTRLQEFSYKLPYSYSVGGKVFAQKNQNFNPLSSLFSLNLWFLDLSNPQLQQMLVQSSSERLRELWHDPKQVVILTDLSCQYVNDDMWKSFTSIVPSNKPVPKDSTYWCWQFWQQQLNTNLFKMNDLLAVQFQPQVVTLVRQAQTTDLPSGKTNLPRGNLNNLLMIKNFDQEAFKRIIQAEPSH